MVLDNNLNNSISEKCSAAFSSVEQKPYSVIEDDHSDHVDDFSVQEDQAQNSELEEPAAPVKLGKRKQQPLQMNLRKLQKTDYT
jgi:hypothetical protein